MIPVTLEFFRYPNYWENEATSVSDPVQGLETAERLVQSLYRDVPQPVMLSFFKDDGEEFRVGFGGKESTLILVKNGEDYYYSIGDPDRTGTAVYLCPEWTEISAKRLIPHEQAKRAFGLWFNGEDVASVVQLTTRLP